MFRCRLLLSISVVAVLLMSVNAMAAYVIVPVPNGGFEQPADGKHNMWDAGTNAKGTFTDVPNWSSDVAAYDSGVASEWTGYTEGVYNGFLCGQETGQPKDPSVWQVLDYTIGEGDQFMLSVDARDNWTEGAGLPAHLQMSLFYVGDGGARNVLATQMVILDGTQGTPIPGKDPWRTYILTLDDSSLGLGRLLGIEFYNPSTARSWVGLDNVRIPEPATIALLGLGGLALLRRKHA